MFMLRFFAATALLALGTVALFALPALAQEIVAVTETPTGDVVIVWQDVAQAIYSTLLVPILGILASLLWKGLARMGIKSDEDTQRFFNEAMQKAANFGANAMIMKAIGNRTTIVENDMLELGVEFFKRNWPDLDKRLGKSVESLKESLLARIDVAAMRDPASVSKVQSVVGPAATGPIPPA